MSQLGRSRTFFLAGIIALAITLLASGCSLLNGSGTTQADPPAGKLEKSTITVGIMTVIDCAPLEIALQRGYFAQEGLTVKTVTVASGTESIPKLVAGTIDVGISNWATVLEAQSRHAADLRIVGNATQGQSDTMIVAALPSSGIRGPRDLAGKTVSTNAFDDVPFLALKAILQANTVDPASVHMVIVPHPSTPQALATHQVDAAIQLEPFITEAAQSSGARPVVDLFDPNGPTKNLPLAGYVSLALFAQRNPHTVAAFQRALARGAADATSRQTVEQVLPSYTRIDKTIASLVTLPVFPSAVTAAQLQRVADLMVTYGLLPARMNVAPLIVPSPS